MHRVIIAVFLLSYSHLSFGVFQNVWKGYQSSKVNQSLEISQKITEEEFKFQNDFNDWKFFVNPSYGESNLASLFSFQSQSTKNKTLNFGLSKDSYKYGSFSITHSKIEYDLSDWSTTSLSSFNSETVFETKTSLNYSYDFLDRSLTSSYDLLVAQAATDSIENQINIEKSYLDFFTTYLQAKYQVYAVDLSKSFVKEARRRVKRTKKRVRDGVSRSVDLSQARSSLLNQEESILSARSSLKENLAILENILGFKVTDNYFSKISWKRKTFSHWSSFISETEHLSVELAKKRVVVSDKNLEKISNQNGYKLLFSTAFSANAMNESQQESYSEHLDTKAKELRVGLRLVIPLGLDKNSALKRRISYQNKKNELDLANKKDDIRTRKLSLKERIKFLESTTELANKKVKLSKLTLSQQNKLYLRGQASFEEVIRAEEAYINARLNEKRALLNYEVLIANYAYLNNSIKPFLNNYRD